MGAMNNLLIMELERRSKLGHGTFDELMDAWCGGMNVGSVDELIHLNSAALESESKGRSTITEDQINSEAHCWGGYCVTEDQTEKPCYNCCFTLGGKAEVGGKIIKVPLYIGSDGIPHNLWGGTDGKLSGHYAMTYERASQKFHAYLDSHTGGAADESLRISLYLGHAMYGNLHIFVIDFDRFDTESSFFRQAMDLADKVTRSQGGGYHMFYGIYKPTATPLFDSINLLASEKARSYVCATGKETLDGTNKVDLFCDAWQFIYEWEEWDNEKGLTDKTLPLYELIRDNFSLKRQRRTPPMDARDRA